MNSTRTHKEPSENTTAARNTLLRPGALQVRASLKRSRMLSYDDDHWTYQHTSYLEELSVRYSYTIAITIAGCGWPKGLCSYSKGMTICVVGDIEGLKFLINTLIYMDYNDNGLFL